MDILVIADPIESLKVDSDSTLFLTHEALKRNHRIAWAVPDGIEWWKDSLIVHASWVEKPWVLGESFHSVLSQFPVIWIRKDPPFDQEYVKLCWLLSLLEDKHLFLNRPSKLLRYHEKLISLEAVTQGFLKVEDIIPTWIGSPKAGAKWGVDLKKTSKASWIRKPFWGFGGRNIEKATLQEWMKYPSTDVYQPYQKEVETRGDRRVMYLNGKRIGDFTRIPAQGKIAANLAQGGVPKMLEWTAEEDRVSKNVGAFLKKADILFAGADMIGSKLSEVNITSPTGIKTLFDLTKENIAKPIVDYFETSVAKHNSKSS